MKIKEWSNEDIKEIAKLASDYCVELEKNCLLDKNPIEQSAKILMLIHFMQVFQTEIINTLSPGHEAHLEALNFAMQGMANETAKMFRLWRKEKRSDGS